MSLSSRPAGNSPLRDSSGGSRSTTVLALESRDADSTPAGLFIISTSVRRSVTGSPITSTSSRSGSILTSAFFTGDPLTVTPPLFTSAATSFRLPNPCSASTLSILSIFIPFPAFPRFFCKKSLAKKPARSASSVHASGVWTAACVFNACTRGAEDRASLTHTPGARTAACVFNTCTRGTNSRVRL